MAPQLQQGTSDAVLAAHTQASTNLRLKLPRVRRVRRFFGDGLSIDDIYSRSLRTRITGIPSELQLPFIFANSNALYRANHFSRPNPATQLEFDIIRAQWYWGIDFNHAFTTELDRIRYNLALMLLVVARPELQQHMKPDSLPFIHAFINAWLEDMYKPLEFTVREAFLQTWISGAFDLTCFTDGQQKGNVKRLKHSLKKLENDESEPIKDAPKGQEEFVAFMQGLNQQQLEMYGPVLAMKWIWARTREVKGTLAVPEKETGIEELFADFGIAKPSSYDLERVDWNDELVQGLLVDVDGNAEKVEVEFNKDAFWMKVDVAMSIYGNKLGDIETTSGGDIQDVDMGDSAMKK